MIKFSCLSHKREKQSNPRLTRLIFQKVYILYCDINNKEEINAAMLVTSMSEHEHSKNIYKELKDSRDNNEKNQPFLKKMNIPSYLNGIQPRSIQV